jgi:magnesium transporter
LIAYNANEVVEETIEDLGKLAQVRQHGVVWINVDGLGDSSTLKAIADEFGLHPLAMEDVLNTHQRAKAEEYQNHVYTVARMPGGEDSFETEQLSIFLVGNVLITFQERVGDCLEPVRNRIRKMKGQIRNKSSDYLLYAIIDTVLDHYFPVVEGLTDRLDLIDENMLDNVGAQTMGEIHRLRNELHVLLRYLRPHREMINELRQSRTELIRAETQTFLRDCNDHVIHLQESIDAGRDFCNDLRDYHMNLVSNRTNDVMKTLTIIATIFIPLSFIAGLYGMNFEYIPELKMKYGYFGALGLMGAIAGGLLGWFWYRGWFKKT